MKNNTRKKYEENHEHISETIFQCSTCERLLCFDQVLDSKADHVTGCKTNVPIFPVKVDQKKCKKYKRITYRGYSY